MTLESKKHARKPRQRRQRGSAAVAAREAVTLASKKRAHTPRQRVPASARVRREVTDRDGECCTFVDETGRRCRETRFLELHYVHAHARGGHESTGNLTWRCRAHNELAAEQDFGRAFMQRQRDQNRAGQAGVHADRHAGRR